MKPLDAMRHIIKMSGKSENAISLELGRSRSYISATVHQGASPTIETMLKVAELTGYRLVLESDTDRVELTSKEVDNADGDKGAAAINGNTQGA